MTTNNPDPPEPELTMLVLKMGPDPYAGENRGYVRDWGIRMRQALKYLLRSQGFVCVACRPYKPEKDGPIATTVTKPATESPAGQ